MIRKRSVPPLCLFAAVTVLLFARPLAATDGAFDSAGLAAFMQAWREARETGQYRAAADRDADGVITIHDADSAIQQALRGDPDPPEPGDVPAADVHTALEGAHIHATTLREEGPEQAAQEVATLLEDRDEVAEVVVSEDKRCIEVSFADGHYWVYLIPPAAPAEQQTEPQADALDISRFPKTNAPRVSVLRPLHLLTCLGFGAENAIGSVCPEMGYNVRPWKGLTLPELDSLSNSRAHLTFIHTHGGYSALWGKTLLATEEPLRRDQSGNVIAPTGYPADWSASPPRIVPGTIAPIDITEPPISCYLVTSEFMREHCSFEDGAMVMIQACHSFDHSDLADACLDKGADAYVGWQGSIGGEDAGERESKLLKLLAGQSELSDTPLNLSNAYLQLAASDPGVLDMRYKPHDSEWGLMPHLDDVWTQDGHVELEGAFGSEVTEVCVEREDEEDENLNILDTRESSGTITGITCSLPHFPRTGYPPQIYVRCGGCRSNSLPLSRLVYVRRVSETERYVVVDGVAIKTYSGEPIPEDPAISSDGNRIAVREGYIYGESPEIHIIDANDGSDISRIEAPSGTHGMRSADYGGGRLVYGRWVSDTEVQVVVEGVAIKTYSGDPFPEELAISGDGHRVAVREIFGADSDDIHIIDANDGSHITRISEASSPSSALWLCDPDYGGGRLAYLRWVSDNEVQVVVDGVAIKTYSGTPFPAPFPDGLAISADGTRVAVNEIGTSYGAPDIHIIDANDGSHIRRLCEAPPPGYWGLFAPDYGG